MGEYIRRDEALQFVFDACTECMTSCEEFDGIYADCNQCMLENVKLKLRDADASDLAPVVHGKWIVLQKFEDCVYAKCSNCDVTQIFYHNKPLTKFCPDCGAKLDL